MSKLESQQKIKDYSFLKDFNDFNLIKKFISIVFLPLLPIHIISKGFQINNWKTQETDLAPSRKKHIFILLFIYIVTVYPLLITIGYLSLQIYIFPISFIIAFLLNKKDLLQTKEREKVDPFTFRLYGFRKLSFTFIFLLLFTFIFSFYGLLWIVSLTAFIFILKPNLYRRLYWIPKTFLFLSYSFFNFLSNIPGIDFSGDWFIERDSEVRQFTSLNDVIKFLMHNFQAVFILNAGITALAVRLLLWVQDDPPVNDVEFLISPEVLSGWGFLFVFLIVPVIMACFFVWKLVWEDAELKIAKTKISTASKLNEGKDIIETTVLFKASDSVTRLFALVFGLPTIIWLVDKAAEGKFTGGNVGLFILIVGAFILTGLTTLFMGIMYYRSGIHEELVNKFRNEIYELNTKKNSDFPVKIGYYTFESDLIIKK